jgi:hypothetical protein
MKKRELSPVELKKVVELRQLGAKWIEIEREAKVERRAAKRAYEEWEKDKRLKEQEAARFRVAAEAFHEHLDDLVRLAESLISVLQIPEILRGLDSAEEALDRLWTRNIQGENEQFPSSRNTIERLVRRNKLLFKSLQEHTREKIRWESLEEWKRARNITIGYSKELWLEAKEVITGILNKRSGLEERLKNAIVDSNVAENIADGVRETIWRGILTGKPDQMHIKEGASSVNKWKVWIEFYEGDEFTRLDLNDMELAVEVFDMCHDTVKNLREETKSHLLQRLTDQVHKMRESIEAFEVSLDVLVLRPIILRTHCDLCPV